MNLAKPLRKIQGILYSAYLQSRHLLPRQKTTTFGSLGSTGGQGVSKIYVINLDSQSSRWSAITWELKRIVDRSARPLSDITTRFSAIDARKRHDTAHIGGEVTDEYTLADQLFVEPQPLAMPDKVELERPIRMSPAEVAVARSHIEVWKAIAEGPDSFALVLEDDVWFERRFAADVDRAWAEMRTADEGAPQFDLLYLSFKEVKHGARKQFLSPEVFRPERGLWYFSGYVLSRKGAARLLELLPCNGPVDLWINHQFGKLDVRSIRHSRISQRLDFNSTNSYSILPSLAKIGVLDSEGAALFHGAPIEAPVFAFSMDAPGASSLAMALSMLGYRCCSDLDDLPAQELTRLLAGNPGRVFNAFVNVSCLTQHVGTLRARYPRAKFIALSGEADTTPNRATELLRLLAGTDVLQLRSDDLHTWAALCQHLRCAPPVDAFPRVPDVGQRTILKASRMHTAGQCSHDRAWDPSPWVVEQHRDWDGIFYISHRVVPSPKKARLVILDTLQSIDSDLWETRDDTFPGNLGLFRPHNVVLRKGGGVSLVVKPERLNVRNFSAAALSSRQKFQFGRFEIEMQATRTPGLVTGFFLHRDSPRQEIDVEIVGNRSDHLLVNVFYNPGQEGSKFDYGYRGTPSFIPLGFDASDGMHKYAIEWSAEELRWYVDGRLVYVRGNWNPTPIPHLPMTLHVNTWPTRSRELAGRLHQRALPGSATVRSISVDAYIAGSEMVEGQIGQAPASADAVAV